MLTPVDVQNKVFKGGIGYDKRDVEMFIREVAADYEQLYRSNVELTDKVATLNESLQHYRATEESMQKALTISEKTAEETINAANDKARQTISMAEKQAEEILANSKEELTSTKDEIFRLQRLHAKFKMQYTKILEGQLKLIDGKVEDIDLGDGYDLAASFESAPRESGLGGLGDGGGYTGASSFDNRFERTNQEPTINRTSLNMDPFADAANGGGRFSRQTGKAFNANYDGNSSKTKKSEGKTGLNVKGKQPSKKSSRVKKDFTSPDTVAANKAAAEAAYARTIDAEKEKKAAKINSATSRSTKKDTKKTKTEPKVENSVNESTNSVFEADSVSSNASTTNTTTTVDTASASTTTSADTKATESFNIYSTESTESTTTKAENVTDTATSSDSFTSFSDVADSVTGEVESKVAENTLIGNDDDNDEGFSFMNDDVWVSEKSSDTSNTDEDGAISGEVENRYEESTLLGNSDNDDEGFDFVEEATEEEMKAYYEQQSVVSGEVEDRNISSTMLDSDDNYGNEFDFVVGEESVAEDIPTISTTVNDSNVVSTDDFSNSNSDDVFEGSVENTVSRSNMIGNDDDNDEGFSFL